MGNLNAPLYRRDYAGETITYVQDNKMQSLYVTPRELPHDISVNSAIVLGNGISRLDSDIQLILGQNNRRVAEGYKLTYACNAAFRDTSADYYIYKESVFFSEISKDLYNKIFLPNNLWIAYRDTNLIPHVYHMDSGSTAAYLAAFDGAKKVFLFGFDRSDGATNENIYSNTLGYDGPAILDDFRDCNTNLYNVIKAYSDVNFYRVCNHHTNHIGDLLKTLPNYHEVSIREAILLGDF